MDSISIQGQVDDQQRLSAIVPASVPPGPVTISISAAVNEDDAGNSWARGISHEWSDELSDTRQDIYSIADGEAIDPS